MKAKRYSVQRNTWFSRFAKTTSHISGLPVTFLIASAVIVVWAVSGPIFHYSDTWQLVINTSTTIITFLMVFLIQNTQNRDSVAIQLKLDELIRVTKEANASLMDLEELEEKELEEIRKTYIEAAEEARRHMRSSRKDAAKAPRSDR
jgi:low affinity Fe/Cu permease